MNDFPIELPEAEGLTRFPLARRGVIMTSLMTGLTLAATRVEAQAIHTDMQGIEAGEVMIPTANGDLPAYYAKPAGPGPFPTILVIEEIFGVGEYLKDVCRRMAKTGRMAVATEIYARQGDLTKMSDMAQIGPVVSSAPTAVTFTDLDSTAAWAAAHGGSATRLGVTGFCRGGRVTWLYASHNPNLKAAVAWYGPIKGPTSAIQPTGPLDVADKLLCPLLGLYGAKDPGILVADVETAATRAVGAGKTVTIVVYPDAGHGFHADYRPSYVAKDAAAGWGGDAGVVHKIRHLRRPAVRSAPVRPRCGPRCGPRGSTGSFRRRTSPAATGRRAASPPGGHRRRGRA